MYIDLGVVAEGVEEAATRQQTKQQTKQQTRQRIPAWAAWAICVVELFCVGGDAAFTFIRAEK